ncbi:MFS transporter [Desulfoscipio sp. XC116]|uniref:MFS transporter n=1 Tax=Desulfoscipio sp. XC116 TaxID=3144975 RepID=UPI00325BB695
MAELNYNQKIIANPFKYKYKALTGAILGYIFDAQDFMVLALVIPLLVKTWGISLASAGLIGTATIFGAALSGYFWGPMIDKFGRKRMLILCLIWFGVFTFLCGFATNYIQLIVLRFIAGIGLGGEWVIGAALVSEFFPPEQRARATSAVQSGWPLGYALALGVNAYFVPTYGWQILFFSGIISLIAAVYIAVLVPESPAWLKAQSNKTEGKESISKTNVKAATWTDLLKGANLKTTLLAFGLCASCLVSYWGAGSWIPAYLSTERGLNLKDMSGYLMILNVGGFIGYYFYGFLADKLGRRANFIFGSLASAVVMLIWINLNSPTAILWMAGVFGFITYGYWGPLAAFVAEQFPTGVRGIGTAFAYASGRMMSALAPFLMGGIASQYSLGLALGLVSVIYATGAIFGYFMKETKDMIIVD